MTIIEYANLCLCGCSGVDDLFEMIQSRTFIYQLGYGLIKIFVVNLFAELRPLFRQMELSAAQDLHARGQDCIVALFKVLMHHRHQQHMSCASPTMQF